MSLQKWTSLVQPTAYIPKERLFLIMGVLLLGVCSIAYADQWEAVTGADTLQAMYMNTVMQGENWRAEYCVDGSVAVVDVGAGKAIDTTNIKDPVVGFVFGQKGLMANLIFEGSKHTKLDKTNDRQNPI